jgi:hypothetical protein
VPSLPLRQRESVEDLEDCLHDGGVVRQRRAGIDVDQRGLTAVAVLVVDLHAYGSAPEGKNGASRQLAPSSVPPLPRYNCRMISAKVIIKNHIVR